MPSELSYAFRTYPLSPNCKKRSATLVSLIVYQCDLKQLIYSIDFRLDLPISIICFHLLTVRYPNKWIQSVRGIIQRKWSILGQNVLNRIAEKLLSATGFLYMTDPAMWFSFEPNMDLNSRKQIVHGFLQWTSPVKLTVPADRL